MDPTELEALRAACQRKLDRQAGVAAAYQACHDDGSGIIAMMDTEERRTFRALLQEARANVSELVVNAVAERLQVTGFRFGGAEDSAAAWAIWQANSMDADAEMVQTDALVQGSSFVLVQPDEDSPVGVTISPESALQACVLYEPGNRHRRRAGYKRFTDEATAGHTEVLITPDQIVTWEPGTDRRRPQVDPNPAGWWAWSRCAPSPARSARPGPSCCRSSRCKTASTPPCLTGRWRWTTAQTGRSGRPASRWPARSSRPTPRARRLPASCVHSRSGPTGC